MARGIRPSEERFDVHDCVLMLHIHVVHRIVTLYRRGDLGCDERMFERSNLIGLWVTPKEGVDFVNFAYAKDVVCQLLTCCCN